MKLVFIHGWGFDARFWETLSPLLPHWEKQFVDLGFFGNATGIPDAAGNILIGHSMGFAHGMNTRKDWAGWIAINSFSRFVAIEDKVGCVPMAALLALRKQMKVDPVNGLKKFYDSIGAEPPATTAAPDVESLCQSLDELRDISIDGTPAAQDKPGLVLGAQNDPLVPIETTMAMDFLHATIKMHASGGHVLPQSEPVWCATMIADFLRINFPVFP